MKCIVCNMPGVPGTVACRRCGGELVHVQATPVAAATVRFRLRPVMTTGSAAPVHDDGMQPPAAIQSQALEALAGPRSSALLRHGMSLQQPHQSVGAHAGSRQPVLHAGSYVPAATGAGAGRITRLLPPGVVLQGRYRVRRVLGAGSFGRVYLADDLSDPSGALVAIKELLLTQFASAAERAEAIAWFQREVSTLLRLRHRAIPTVHGYWTAHHDAGPLYLAMDYIPGKTLEDILAAAERAGASSGCPWRTVVAWGIALCEILSYLHSAAPPYVFRDLKLSNVMLDERTNAPALIDFGIARPLAQAGGTVIGTWGYVPLEQVLGKATPRSDIYALGAVLHALLTGRRPNVEYARLQRAGSDLETALRALFPPAGSLTPGIPDALTSVLARATAFDQTERFPDAAALAAALRDVLEPAHPAEQPVAARVGDEPSLPAQRRVTVCSHGTGHYTSIAAAIRDAEPGSRIEVRPGLYPEALVLDKPLEIVGIGPAMQVVVESAQAPCVSMRTRSATIRGLALRGGPQLGRKRHHVVDVPRGRLLLEDCRINSGALACVAIRGNAAEAVIRRCAIQHGQESGVLVEDDGRCLLEECTISGNAVGIAIRRYACTTVRHCTVRDSVSHGIATGDYAEGRVEDCEILDNGQAGICIDRGSMLAVERCRISGNERGIAVAGDGGGTVAACDLRGNLLGAWALRPGAETWLRRARNRE